MKSKLSTGLAFKRHHTKVDTDPLDQFEWANFEVGFGDQKRTFEAPASWTFNAASMLQDKYAIKVTKELPQGETSAKQVFLRLADTFAHWAEKHGYLSGEDLKAYRDELLFALASQRLAPNSPVWFNCGRHHKYGMSGPAGQWRVPDDGTEAAVVQNALEHPQMSACFIQRVDDAMFGGHGIYDVMSAEARLFKYGSGTGSNFSAIRGKGEPLAGGGGSSGLMGFLEAFDASAGVVKSGGTTRRAAKMVQLDMDHPEIEAFITWKAHEEDKARALIDAGYSPGFEGEAVRSIKGQNSNNSVFVPERFLKAVQDDGVWRTVRRTDGAVAKEYKARYLWNLIAEAAWKCADPGVQFDGAIQKWHTCKNDGPIRATNPCSEYIFLDDTSCNLSSINLLKYIDGDKFDTAGFVHVVQLAQITMDLVIESASFPTKSIAERTRKYRTTGLGYANMGALLMYLGLPYGTPQARAVAAAITSLMTAESYLQSSRLAESLGAFERFETNRDPMLEVIQLHQDAAQKLSATGSGIPEVLPGAPHAMALSIADKAVSVWSEALARGAQFGYRNAQTVVIAPTGTIGLTMGCDTTGIEPAYSLVVYKSLVGGNGMVLTIDTVPLALANLGYTAQQIRDIQAHIDRLVERGDKKVPFGSMVGAPHIKPEHLAIFAAANDPAGNSLSPMDHLEMVAAIQPFLSGGVSKTINLPEQTTVEQVQKAYEYAHKLGCKNTALYRDNSKVAQVLAGAAKTARPQNREVVIASLSRDEVADVVAKRFPDLCHLERLPVVYRYDHSDELSFKIRDLLHPEGFRVNVNMKFNFWKDNKLHLEALFVTVGQSGDILHEVTGDLSAEWSRRLRSGVEKPMTILNENMNSKGLGGGIVMEHPILRGEVGSWKDAVWKAIAIEVFNKHDFVQAGLWETYNESGDRKPFIWETIAKKEAERGAPRREPTLAAFTEPLDVGYKPRQPDMVGLKCPTCGAGPELIRPIGSCKECTKCGEKIGGC
jgi:ribonucleoside-diphosphate reductase alpha chain